MHIHNHVSWWIEISSATSKTNWRTQVYPSFHLKKSFAGISYYLNIRLPHCEASYNYWQCIENGKNSNSWWTFPPDDWFQWQRLDEVKLQCLWSIISNWWELLQHTCGVPPPGWAWHHEIGALFNLVVTLLVASLSPPAWKQLRAKKHDETETIFHYIWKPKEHYFVFRILFPRQMLCFVFSYSQNRTVAAAPKFKDEACLGAAPSFGFFPLKKKKNVDSLLFSLNADNF